MKDEIASKQVENRAVSVVEAGTDALVLQRDHPNSPENIERRHANKLVERNELGQLLKGSVTVVGPRPRGQTVTVLARTFTERAINLLGKVMDDERAPQAARVQAAQGLLDRGWGKSPIQIDLNVRAKFDDFLRDVGLQARYEHDHPVVGECEQQGQQGIADVIAHSALDEQGRIDDEHEGIE
jgi:hypothetical protein